MYCGAWYMPPARPLVGAALAATGAAAAGAGLGALLALGALSALGIFAALGALAALGAGAALSSAPPFFFLSFLDLPAIKHTTREPVAVT